MSVAEHTQIAEAPAALEQIAAVIDELTAGGWWRLAEEDLGQVLAVAGQVRHAMERLEAHATAEAITRGLPGQQGLSAVDYLIRIAGQYAPEPSRGHALSTVRIAEALNSPALAVENTVAGFDAGLISASKASAVIRFHDDVAPVSDPQALASAMETINDGVTDQLLTNAPDGWSNPDQEGGWDQGGRDDPAGANWGNSGGLEHGADAGSGDSHSAGGDAAATAAAGTDGIAGGDGPGHPGQTGPSGRLRYKRGWTDRELSMMLRRARRLAKPEKDSEDEERAQRARRAMYALPASGGMTEYRLYLDPEGAAIVDAAVAALSKPRPAEDGAPDLRGAPTRRADALLTIVERGVSAPEGTSQTTKAQVFVTIGLSELLSQAQGAGLTMTGQVLSPGVVRRMACDGGIIPAVLGSEGEVLDQGREVRLFTPGQQRALWHRDQGCTFPGCTIPAQWCAAHHVQHWLHNGPTNVDNGALLCRRHHTHVHTHDLTATVTSTGVTWHT